MMFFTPSVIKAMLPLVLFSTYLAFLHGESEDMKSASVIAFGSCNRQNKPQDHWEVIRAVNPDLFLWTGDHSHGLHFSLITFYDCFIICTLYTSTAIDIQII